MSKIPQRERVAGPPKGWRPRALTIAEKLQVVVNQRGWHYMGAVEALDPMGVGVDFDHVPAIHERRWDPKKGDTIPPSCDLNYIVAVNRPAHRTKTAKRDIKEIAKTRRLETADERRAEKAAKRFLKTGRVPRGQRIALISSTSARLEETPDGKLEEIGGKIGPATTLALWEKPKRKIASRPMGKKKGRR